jgi:hypothetical protein
MLPEPVPVPEPEPELLRPPHLICRAGAVARAGAGGGDPLLFPHNRNPGTASAMEGQADPFVVSPVEL